MKLGIFGGTFDPVHKGHLAVADGVRRCLSLDEVLFVPAGQPWLKGDTAVLSAEHRIAMLRLAISGRSHYSLSLVEVNRQGPTYTLDTLSELWARFRAGDDVSFIMGWDSLSQFPRWHAPERIIRLCRLVAVPRPGSRRPDLTALEKDIPGLSQRVTLLDGPNVDVSATDIRQRITRGQSVDELVPPAVAEYIRQHRLYLGEPTG